MRHFGLALIVSASIAWGCGIDRRSEESSGEASQGINGGTLLTAADLDWYDYVVLLRRPNDDYGGTGVLIACPFTVNVKVVLTAGHCAEASNNVNSIRFRPDGIATIHAVGARRIKDTAAGADDLALLQIFPDPLTSNAALLPTSGVGSPTIASSILGYGRDAADASHERHLQIGDVDFTSVQSWWQPLPGTLRTEPNGTGVINSGDSGGPLHTTNTKVVDGIHSAGNDSYAYDAPVYPNLEWIYSAMQELCPTPNVPQVTSPGPHSLCEDCPVYCNDCYSGATYPPPSYCGDQAKVAEHCN